MKIYSFLLSSALLLSLHLCEAVPVSFGSRSQPCEIQTELVLCYGPSITDASLLMLKDELHTRFSGMYFRELLISNTDINRITADVFAEVEFETIIISENEYLTYIDQAAFKNRSKTTSLNVSHNPLLKGNMLYKLADRLEVTEMVDLEFNSLEEVPSHAFNHVVPPPSTHGTTFFSGAMPTQHPVVNNVHHFKKLDISNNKIEHIRVNAFHLLDSCSEISLANNQVTHIASHGFNLANHLSERDITKVDLKIMLNKNKLTADSFEASFIELNDHTNLLLDLSNNEIAELKEDVFKPLLSKNIFIDLTGNKVTCKGATAWLFHEENAKLVLKTKGITC